jgi:hypothetical protein
MTNGRELKRLTRTNGIILTQKKIGKVASLEKKIKRCSILALGNCNMLA